MRCFLCSTRNLSLWASRRLLARLGSVLVRDVSLTVEPGRLVTMMGPNGAGKTTLPEALAGMLGFASRQVAVTTEAVDA